jgi:hypothetical protein
VTATDVADAALTDRMRIYDQILRDNGHGTLREFLASRCAGDRAQPWEQTAEELRAALGSTTGRPPRWSVTQMAHRLGITNDYKGRTRPVMTDRMKQYDAALQKQDTTLHEFIATRHAADQSWGEIAKALREAVNAEGDGYVIVHESVIRMAQRLGIITGRPKGNARRRRRSGRAE